MRLLIRVLLVFFVISALLSIVRGLLNPTTPNRRQARGNPPPGGRLIKDPICGIYVAESSALQAGENYFCSEECRQKFIAAKA